MTVVLTAVEVRHAAGWAALAPALRTPPWGFGWAAALLPATPATAELLSRAVLVTAALGLVGLFTRAALCATAGLLLVVLALPQQWGASVHTHHLLWFTVLLAAAPSGDALSIDAWRARRRGEAFAAPSVAHGLAVRAAWVSIGLLFFFPGLWKWRTQGLDWALSDNLLHQLHFKWLERGEVSVLRVDRWPAALHAGGIGVLLLEPALLPLWCVRVTRPFAVAAAAAFHAATRVIFLISFSSLWACYTVFVPWAKWLGVEGYTRPARRAAWPVAAVAGLVLSGQLVSGALGVEHGWPFACYPTFRHDPGAQAAVLIAEEERGDGARRELPLDFLAGDAGQREWSAMWRLLTEPRPELLRAWWQAHRPAADAVRVRFYRGTLAIAPDAARVPVRGELMAEVAPVR